MEVWWGMPLEVWLGLLEQTKYSALFSVGYVCYNLCVYVGTGSTR